MCWVCTLKVAKRRRRYIFLVNGKVGIFEIMELY